MTMPNGTVPPIYSASAQTKRESRIPVALDDTLLPKLISGGLQWKSRDPYVAAVTT